MRYLLLLIYITFSTQFTNGQNPISTKEMLTNAYTDYFNAERETIYLHFNKNTFFNTEPIWFKGYVFDKKNSIPFISTTNVYVSLIDVDGNEIINKLFFAQNGLFSGSFDIESSIPAGNYYIKAYTNWMNNFVEDESYTSSPIKILNTAVSKEEDKKPVAANFDLQFLPEGGHCISGVTNTFGLKITDCNSEGLEIEGVIKDSKGTLLTNFKSNAFGLGKFDLAMEDQEIYTAYYSIDGEEYTLQLPNSEPQGFSISVNNYTNATTTFVSLKTNPLTLQNTAGKTYFLVINQNNKVSVVDLKTDELTTNNTIPISNKNLISGINTISLFDDQLHPILERLIFNYDENSIIKSNIFVGKVTQDSIPINLRTYTNSNTSIATNLSIAILPKESIAYSKKEDIISAFLLKPYLKGYIQNPHYYFSNIDRLKKYDLDLLLLTQGWSKYTWKNIKTGAQKLAYAFDAGLSIKGTVNIPKNSQGYSVQLFSIANNLNEIAQIDKDNMFYFNNFFLKDSAQLNFTVLKDGVIIDKIKPFAQLTDNKHRLKYKFKLQNQCRITDKTIHDYSTFLTDGQVLDTISLAYKKTYKVSDLEHEKSYIANVYSKGIKIDSITKRYYKYVLDIINSHGFAVDEITSASIKTGKGMVRIKNRNPVTFMASNEPLLVIDDSPYGNNYDVLLNMTLDDIDEIYIDPNGNGYGARGGAGVIRVYRKQGGRNSNKKNVAHEFIVNHGFSTEKKFYIPQFYSLSKSNFLNYVTIDWHPNITTDNNGRATYSIFNTNTTDAIAIIQGFSADGKLLSEIKEIKLLE